MAMPQSTLLTCSILRAQGQKMKVTMVQQALEPISTRPLEKLVPKVTFRFLLEISSGPAGRFHEVTASGRMNKTGTRSFETRLGDLAGRSRFALAFRKQANHLTVEGWDVVGPAACNHTLIVDDFLVDPAGAGVLEIGFQRRPGGHRAPANRSRFEQRPRAVTDRGYGFAGIRELLYKLNGRGIQAQMVGVHHSTRQEQSVEFFGIGGIQRNVHGDFFPPILLVQPLIFLPAGETTCVVAPASSNAFLGSSNSDCSKPSVARIATFFP